MTAPAKTALARTVLARTVLGEVLIGRDPPPAWRGERTHRAAVVAGWAGWALLALTGLIGVTATGHAGQAGAVRGPEVLGWLAVALAVVAALPVATRFALLAWRIAFLGVLVTPLIPGQTRADGGYYAVLAVTLAVAGMRYGPRHLWCMYVLSLIPVWLWTGPDSIYPAVNTGWLALLAVVVNVAAYWRRDRQALAVQAQDAEHQRERNAVLEERARIAREMHDVVAHHMSMIAVQAETAPYRLAAKGSDTPEPVAREFTALSAAAREALTDMRRLLGVLRSDTTVADNSKKRSEGGGSDGAGDGGTVDRTPQPRLEDIPVLVESARRSGTRVTLTTAGSPARPVPPGAVPQGVGLAAYRIVQESLSNAARHAPGAEVCVRVEHEEGALRVTVVNEPPATPRQDGTDDAGGPGGHGLPGEHGLSGGHGLTGMRERAALLGGTLDAGPAGDGGFAVRAVLPAGGPA